MRSSNTTTTTSIIFCIVWTLQAASAFTFHLNTQLPHLKVASSVPSRNTWLSLKASSSTTAQTTSTTEVYQGLYKTIAEEGNGPALRLGDIVTVKYTCFVGDDVISFSPQQKCIVGTRGESGMIEGWDKAIQSMRVGERSIFSIQDPALGYGSAGVPPIIPPNAVLEMDVTVLRAQPATANIDFDSLANLADATPTTAADIAAAFEARQAAKKALGPEKEGLEAFIEKAKNFYFFGLFEGETGERPPWFLRPSITFPLAFAVVGLAFYVSLKSGAMTERGRQATDELDEIILSSNLLLNQPGVLIAMAMNAFSNSDVNF